MPTFQARQGPAKPQPALYFRRMINHNNIYVRAIRAVLELLVAQFLYLKYNSRFASRTTSFFTTASFIKTI
jgi:hypothetical protein